MAKQRQNSSDKEMKKLIEGLYNAIQTMNSNAKESVKINRDLLKTMSILNSGFAQNEQDARELIEQVRNGAEITDEFAVKWAKQRKVAQKDIDEMIKKFRELETIDEDIIDNSKDYIDLLEERYSILDDEVDLTKKLLGNQEAILKIVNQTKKSARELTGSASITDELLEKMVSRKIDLSSLFDGMTDASERINNLISDIRTDIDGLSQNVSGNIIEVGLKFNPLTGQLDQEMETVLKNIQEEKDARSNSLLEYFKMNTQLQEKMSKQMASSLSGMDVKIDIDTGDIETANGLLEVGTSEFEKMSKRLESIAQKNNVFEIMNSNFKELTDLISIGTDLTSKQEQRLNDLLMPLDAATKMLATQIIDRNSLLDSQKAELIKEKELFKLLAKSSDKLKTSEAVVRKVADGFDYINSILPTGISEFLGVSKVSGALIDSHRRGVQDFNAELMKSENTVSAMNSYMKSFKSSISGVINPTMLLVIGATLLYKFVSGITEKYKEMSSNMKISLGQSKQLLEIHLDILSSQKNQFASMEDIQEIQSKMIGDSGKLLGLSSKKTKELTIHLSEIGKYFGYGNEQAVQLHKTFGRLGADDKLSLSLQRNVGFMAEMAGLSPQIVARDLIDSADEVSMYFAGLPEQAAKAVIQVRRMGMSLKQAGSIAQKMLNLESFMTDMYELQAMTRGGIDFSSAFDKGLMGDIEGMTRDIMNEIGSISEFNKMDFLTRKKIANTLGMSTDELAKSVMLHEKMTGLDAESAKYLDANLDKMGDISAMSQKDIRNKLKQLQSTDRLGIAWDKIKGVLVKSLLPLVESFADAVNLISPVIDIIVMGFKGIGSLIKGITLLLRPFFQILGWIGDKVSIVTGHLDEWGDSLNGVSSWIGTITKAAIGFVQVWASMKALKFTGIIKSDLGDVMSMLPGIGSLTGKIFGKATKDVSQSVVESSQVASTAITQTVAKTTSATDKMTKDVSKKVKKIKGEVKDVSNTSLINVSKTSDAFKTVAEIGTKALASWAVSSAMEFAKMEEDGKGHVSKLGSFMQSVLPMAAPLMIDSIQHAMSKVLTKKVEGKLTDAFKKLGKKAGKSLGDIDKPVDAAFGRIINKGKGLFAKITGKKVTEDSSKSIVEKVNKTAIEKVTSKSIIEKTPIPDVQTPIKGVEKKVGSGFSSLTKIFKTAWSGLKTVLNDIVKFISNTMKELSSGIETTIKNILKGIGDGLSSFKTSAIKGAASLVILSGALWITSKALQNFVGIKWEDLAKAGVALGGLLVVGLLLGSASAAMLLGAAAIAALGLALIPTAQALTMFNEVNWSSLAKAGVALIGLGVVGSILGAAAPLILVGAGAMAFASIGIMTFTTSLEMMNKSIQNLSFEPLKGLVSNLLDLTSISIVSLFGVAGGISAIAMSLLTFNTMTGMSGVISAMFGGNVIKDLQKLGELADPLYIVNKVISELGSNLKNLSIALAEIDFSNFDQIKKFGIDTVINQKVQPQISSTPVQVNEPNRNYKISPNQPQIASTRLPDRKEVAQDKVIRTNKIYEIERNEKLSKERDNYYEQDMVPDNQKTDMLLQQIVDLLSLQLKQNLVIQMDGQKAGQIIKRYNNK